MPRVNAYWPILAALLLNGCLLPQPDTPIIPPRMGDAVNMPHAAPVPVPVPDVPRAGEAGMTVAQPNGTLNVVPSGLGVSAITAVAVEDAGRVVKSEAAEGGYRFSLPPGRYWLDVVAEGQVLRVGQAIDVQAGAARAITLTLSKDPLRAVVQEEVPLAPPATDAATPEEPTASGS